MDFNVLQKMAFSIAELHELEPDVTHAHLIHGDELFVAIIPEPLGRLRTLSAGFVAELDYQSVSRYEAGLTKADSASGIFATDDVSVVLVDGSVSNLLEIDTDHVLVDVYVQNGPEFVTVNSEELGNNVLEVGTRVRLWLQGLKIYPSFT